MEIRTPCSYQQLNAFLRCINQYILDNYFYICSPAWKPCQAGWQEIVIRWPMCFSFEYDQNQLLIADFCEDAGYCAWYYRVCVQQNGEVLWQYDPEYFPNPRPEGSSPCTGIRFDPDNFIPGVCYNTSDCQ